MQDTHNEGAGSPRDARGWTPRNWNKKTEAELRKLPAILKSRYLAYEEPPKNVTDAQTNTMKRLAAQKRIRLLTKKSLHDLDELDELAKQEKLVGQLKAAEARNRIRIMRLRYENNKASEVNHLIASQPTARKAVRLQALLPVKPEDRTRGDIMDKLSRRRVETLLEDEDGLTTKRTGALIV
ncbi:hypothetical protein LSAT2_021230 [Lamellibrachia satsuma]|nr:hypothetical protein LSAT2_021230 [Lamellibrachia satsuma]